MDPRHVDYVGTGGSWRPFRLVAGTLGLLLVMDLVLPGRDVPPPVWALALLAAAGGTDSGPGAGATGATPGVPGAEGTLGP